MNKILLALLLSGTAMSASAAQMECMVDTLSLDKWGTGECFSMEFTFDSKPNLATWRLKNVTKTIDHVIWLSPLTCGLSATQCSKMISPYSAHVGSALVYYTDGTSETLSATASFETGF